MLNFVIKNYTYLISIISFCCSVILFLVYIWYPFTTSKFDTLIVELIPNAILVLISFPIIYSVFIRRGIKILSLHQNIDINEIANQLAQNINQNKLTCNNNDFDNKSSTESEPMTKIQEELSKITSRVENLQPNVNNKAIKNNNSQGLRDALIIVDIQNDFFEKGALPVPDAISLIKPLNKTIENAEKKGVLIIYTQDWHPEDHKSFKGFGGKWNPHCINGTKGAKLHHDLREAVNSETIKFGTNKNLDGYSPFENQKIIELLSDTTIREIFVVGIAAEYCVLATCIEAKQYFPNVTVIESLVKAADPSTIITTWKEYDNCRVRRVLDAPL